MGKKTTNAVNKNKEKEKRQARKLEQRRIADGMSCVTTANKLNDLAALCKELLIYRSKELEVDMYIQRVSQLEKDVLNWAIDLTERNMKRLLRAGNMPLRKFTILMRKADSPNFEECNVVEDVYHLLLECVKFNLARDSLILKYQYETCVWGWNRERKVEEMTDDASWYLIAKDKKGSLLAFSHFRFDMDFGDPVLYCYEVQVEEEGRRRGLGQRVLSVLEKLAHATRMTCVRLTALTHNPAASAFFRACGYILDETSPPKEEAAHYEILSKATDAEVQAADSTEQRCALSEGMRNVQVANHT